MKKIKLVVICLLLVAAITAAIYVMPPIITGSTKFLNVLSGSMSPIMNTGDLIVVTPVDPENIEVGDIIAHEDPDRRENVIITHRVVEIIEEDDEEGDLSFRTKGDANEDVDIYTVDASDLVGKAAFVIPSLGYFFHYMRGTKLFLLLLVVAPAMLIIIDEVRNIMILSNPVLARKAIKEEKRRKRRASRIINYKRLLLLFCIITIVFGAISLPFLVKSGSVTDINVGTLKIENREALPGVCIFNIINDPRGEISISPRYIVLPPKSDTEVEVEIMMDAHETDTGGSGLEHEHALITVSKSPYIMPVFWIDILAKINPYLPGLVSTTIPPILLTFMLFPIWFHRRVKYKYKHRMHIFKKLKRRLLIATF
jgi:signal peptidase